MASLDLSTNGKKITDAYNSIVNHDPSISWMVLSVDSSPSKTVSVQSTGTGSLEDIQDEFNDGKEQYSLIRVKEPTGQLVKFVLIGWCGEGVPISSKGYFSSHFNQISNTLRGYHVQITARSQDDLDPVDILKRVSNAAGARYSIQSTGSSLNNAFSKFQKPSSSPKPTSNNYTSKPTSNNSTSKPFSNNSSTSSAPVVTKPPKSFSTNSSFPIKFTNDSDDTTTATTTNNNSNIDKKDNDGWGSDAPPVTYSKLTNVETAYKPTKVDLNALKSTPQQQPPSTQSSSIKQSSTNEKEPPIKGTYQPIGKVDIAAIKKASISNSSSSSSSKVENSNTNSDREPIRGSYQPVGKVDLAAIRASAKAAKSASSNLPEKDEEETKDDSTEVTSVKDRMSVFSSHGISSLPKPKTSQHSLASRWESDHKSSSSDVVSKPDYSSDISKSPVAPALRADKNFGLEDGKTPAQLWAESHGNAKFSAPSEPPVNSASNTTSTDSLGFTKKEEEKEEEDYKEARNLFNNNPPPSAQKDDTVSSLNNKFANTSLEKTSSLAPRPSFPGLDSKKFTDDDDKDKLESDDQDFDKPPRPTNPLEDSGASKPVDIREKLNNTLSFGAPPTPASAASFKNNDSEVPPPLPTRSEEAPPPLPSRTGSVPEPSVPVSVTASASTPAPASIAKAESSDSKSRTAKVVYDYERDEENEISLSEGEIIYDIDFVDTDWWSGRNSKGEIGLFPFNYVELIEDSSKPDSNNVSSAVGTSEKTSSAGLESGEKKDRLGGPSAIAEYDYEALEDNELSFPEGAVITDVEFPDEDWWSGVYNGKRNLFPANYVKLQD